MNEAAVALYIGETIGCVLFCALFVLRSRGWWRTRMGPNLFAMMFVLAVFQGLSLVARVIAPEWFLAHATPIRFWCFLAMFVTVWWRVILLLRIQHEDAIAAHEDAMGAHREAADAHEDAAEAHRDAAVSHQDAVTARDDAAIAQEDTRRTNTGDTDPDLKPVA